MWELKNLDTGEVKYVVEWEHDYAYRFVATNLNGSQVWYEASKLHRNNGPAVTLPNGAKRHYEHGRLLGWNGYYPENLGENPDNDTLIGSKEQHHVGAKELRYW